MASAEFRHAFKQIQKIHSTVDRLSEAQRDQLDEVAHQLIPIDQIDKTSDLGALIKHTLVTEQPERYPYPVSDVPSERLREVAQYIGAMISLLKWCPHAATDGPLMADLVHGTVYCQECADWGRSQPRIAADVCDGCHARGVREFTPITFAFLKFIVIGDVCNNCRKALGLNSTS
jgi:hypothetical protein